MTGSNAGAIISMKVLVKLNMIPPERICLEFRYSTVYRPSSRLVSKKNPDQAIRNFPRNFKQVDPIAGTRRELYFEVISIEQVEG